MKLPKAYATQVKKRSVDMTTSVNPLGCSPRVLKAFGRIRVSDIAKYPDQQPLIRALAGQFGVNKGCIILGTGSEQLIKLIAATYTKKNSRVAVESGSFFLFSREPSLLGADIRLFDATDQTTVPRKPDLLFMANPTTPGGVNRSVAQLLSVIDAMQPKIAVIDEANGEFTDQTVIPQIRTRTNLIVLRTFSKALGLAGLRVGMAFANRDIINKLNDFQQPFPVSSTALIAANAAMNDAVFLERTKRFIAAERIFLTRRLTQRGFLVTRSVTNNLFVMRNDAKAVIRMLAALDVSVIDGSFFPGNITKGFRISLRDKRTNRKFLARLDEALACLSTKKLLGSKEDL